MALPNVLRTYTSDLEGTYKSLHQRTDLLQSHVHKNIERIIDVAQNSVPLLGDEVRKLQDDAADTLQDMQPVPPQTHKLLVESQLWAAICLLGLTLSQFFGGTVLAPFINMMFSTECSIFLTYILIPLHYMVSVQRGAIPKGQSQRAVLFGLSITMGLLSGCILSDKYLGFFVPQPCIMPAAIGVVASLVGNKLDRYRHVYLGVTVGAGLVATLGFGYSFQSMVPGFIGWAVAISCAAVADLQYKMTGVTPSPAAAACITVFIQLVVQSMMIYILGGPGRPVPAPKIIHKRKKAATRFLW